MRKISILFLLFAILFTQSTYSQIGIKIGPMLGLTNPTSDYSGETTDFYAGTKYGMKSGFHFGALGKLVLGPLNGRASLSYISMSNDGTSDPTTPNSTVDISNKLFMITLGTEFGFAIPFSPVRPYAGLDLLITTISGTVNFQGTPEVNSSERDIASATRTGLGFAIGSEIGFGKSFVLDLSLRYNLHNLFGKEYEGVTNSSDRNFAYLFLNDAKDPNYSAIDSKHPIGSDRTIATIQFNVGLLFGF